MASVTSFISARFFSGLRPSMMVISHNGMVVSSPDFFGAFVLGIK
jgi:hypothetical protein